MEKNFNYVEHTDELKSVTGKGNKAIQLTPRSYSRIIGKVSKWASTKTDKTVENDISNVEENSNMIQPEQIGNSEKTIARVQNIINILEEKDIINSNSRLEVVGSRPIRLMPKMFEAPYAIYTVARNKFTKIPEENVDVQNIETTEVNTVENGNVELSKEREEQMARRLEEEINKVYAELKEENNVKEDNNIAETNVESSENVENNDYSDLNSFEEVKQNYLNIMNRVKEQNDNLEKADQELKAAEQAKINAETAKKEAMNRLIEQTILQQKVLEDTMRKESEINRQISVENEQTEMLNRETEELLAMLVPEEESSKQKVA